MVYRRADVANYYDKSQVDWFRYAVYKEEKGFTKDDSPGMFGSWMGITLSNDLHYLAIEKGGDLELVDFETAGTVSSIDYEGSSNSNCTLRNKHSMALAFSPDDALLAECTGKGVQVYQVPNLKLVYSLPSLLYGTIEFSPDGSELWVLNNRTKEWTVVAPATGKEIRKSQEEPLFVYTQAQGSQAAASGSSNPQTQHGDSIPGLLSAEEITAADKLGVTEKDIIDLIVTKKLNGKKVGEKY